MGFSVKGRAMQLKRYLSKSGEDPGVFSEKVGVTIYAMRKWLRGERIPRPETIMKIKKATDGLVTAEDWIANHK